MEERRKVQRGRTLKAGSIVFNSAAGIDWRVRNMSAAGACLEVTSQVGVPTILFSWLATTNSSGRATSFGVRTGVEFRAA